MKLSGLFFVINLTMKILPILLLNLISIVLSAQVGIGTTSPTVPLDIEATDAAIDINNTAADGDPKINFQLSSTTTFSMGIDDTDDKFKIGTTAPDASTSLTIESDGSVGIGITSPQGLFNVDGGNSFFTNGDIRIDEDGDGDLAGIGEFSGGLALSSSGDAASNIHLFIENTSGEVGIGTSSPGALLDVRGSAIFNEAGASVDFRVEGDTEANLLFVDGSADRIGIGTTSPATTLDVDGTLILLNGTSINEFSIDGTMAGNSDDAVPTEAAIVTYVNAEKASLTKTITIEAPTNTDYFPLFRTDVAITVQEAIGMLNATGDVDVTLYWDTDFAETSPTAIGTVTTLTAVTEETINIASDATIPANSWIFVDIPEATSAQTVTVNVRYAED